MDVSSLSALPAAYKPIPINKGGDNVPSEQVSAKVDTSKSSVSNVEQNATKNSNVQEAIDKSIDDLNSALGVNNNLRFEVDKDSERMVVQITDRETNKVIRQIPSEEMLRLSEHLKKVVDEMNSKNINSSSASGSNIKGFLLQEKA